MAYKPQAQGAQNPGKYPFVGSAYQYWGEQPGFIYDPYRDAYRPDPKTQQQYYESQGLGQKNNSPGLGQVAGLALAAPIVYGAGQALGNKTGEGVGNLIDGATKPTAPTTNTGQQSGGMIGSSQAPAAAGTPAPAPQPASGQSGGMVSAPANASAAPSAGNVQAVGSATMPDGSPGYMMNDGTIVSESGTAIKPDGSTVNLAPYLQGAAGVAALINAYQQYKSGDKVGAGLSGAQGAANIAAASGSQTAGSVAPYLGAAVAAYGGYKTLDNDAMTEEQKATRLQQQAGLAVADFYTYGAASALEGLARKNKTTGKWLGKIDELDRKTNLITMGLSKFMPGMGTREIAKKHTGELYNASEDPTYRQYVEGMRAQYNEDPKDPTKPFAGKYQTWEDYKKGGLEAADLTGVYGNIKVYGPDWAKLTQEQRQAVTQENINSGLYNSKKGEVEITDENLARQNFEKVIGAKPTPIGQSNGMITNKGPAPIQPGQTPGSVAGAASGGMLAFPVVPPPNRSQTRSPGIGKDGKRIQY